MLLFKPYHVDMILEGLKTQTRRSENQKFRTNSLHWAQLNYTGESRFAQLRIKRVRKEELGQISDIDAQKEGYASREEFREAWITLFGTWNERTLVTVVDFVVVHRLNQKTLI